MSKRRYWASAALAVAALAFGQPASAADEIAFGICQSTSSGSAKFATALWKGAEIAIHEANAAGGVEGRKVVLVPMDIGNTDPAQARLSMRKAIQVNKIVSLLCWGTNVMVQNGPMIDEEGILAFTTAQGVNITKKSKLTQQLDAVTTFYCRVAVAWIRQRHPEVKTFGVLYVNYEYGLELRDMCEAEFGKHGIKMVAAEGHPNAPPDLRAQFTKIMQAKPDAVFLASIGGGTVAQAIRTGRELGYEGIFMTHGAGDIPDIYNLKVAEKNFFYAGHAVPETAPKAVFESAKEYGGFVGAGYDFAWIDMMLARELIKEGKPVTGANMAAKLRALGTVQTPINKFTFLEDGKTIRPMAIFTIANGEKKLEKILGDEELK